MAQRPVFIPSYDSELLVNTEIIDFRWHAGMAASQKRKSIAELHASAIDLGICNCPLEVSSKSLVDLGVQLSAFNLSVKTSKRQRVFTVETAYQSSKCFESGGPYTDLLYGTALAAKQDSRLKGSGKLVEFVFFGERWPLEPKTAFYDWLYLNALQKNEQAVLELDAFDAFTDIEFNPKKSFNCQAYSVALYKSLHGRGILKDALESKDDFLAIIGDRPLNDANEDSSVQPYLL